MVKYSWAVVPALPWMIVALPLRAWPPASNDPPRVLPAPATQKLAQSLARSAPAAVHTWRDGLPVNEDGTVNAYIEIPRGDLRKWEFDMGLNARAMDRLMPPEVGPYPVNYGFVPATVSYVGDPLDVLVLGPPLTGGSPARGVIVGVFHMDDEMGMDSKVVVSRVSEDGRPLHAVTDEDRRRVSDYFARYKRHEPGKWTVVRGWGSADEARALITVTHAFFRECRDRAGAPCALP